MRWLSARYRLLSPRDVIDAFGPVLILIAQNLAVFKNHYFREYTFPWDFGNQLYAYTAFWTSVVQQGVFPSWVPFFGMGMPFDLILQSGWHYPPLYVFPLLRIAYSLHAAVVFQCLHVLFGALGMLVFLRLVFHTSRVGVWYALVGAFTFQFFGGFYSNAEHVDIVRAFAYAPWLFYAFTIPAADGPRFSSRFLFIPPLLFLVATGAYPGNLISSIAVLNLYFLLQLVAFWRRGAKPGAVVRLCGSVLFLELLGAGMSVVHLGPAWFFKSYLQRAGDFQTLARFSLGIEHLPALFLNNRLVPGEVSMTSTFVTLPALILCTYVPLRIVREHWPMAAILGFSVLMAAGDNSLVGILLPKWIAVLRYSRWPSSDYRVFIAISLIYFATLSARELLEGRIAWNSFLLRTGFVALWFSLALYAVHPDWGSAAVRSVIAVCLAAILCLAIPVLLGRQLRLHSALLIVPLLALVSVDAARVLPHMDTWKLQASRRLRLYDLGTATPERRPARLERQGTTEYDWEGFITGRYILSTFIRPNMLGPASLVLEEPAYKEYMLAAWTPLFRDGPPEIEADRNDVEVPPEWIGGAFRSSADAPLTQVRQTRYGLNEIAYEVSLGSPRLMIENEMYFPGWTAGLESAQGPTSIRAVSVNGLFRAWLLPAGDYTMRARFEFPYAKAFAGISAVAFASWVLVLSDCTRRAWRRHKSRLVADNPES
jgi:hypothetical protein